MGKVQVFLHVEQRISFAENQVHRLPMRHDILRCLGISRNSSLIRFVFVLEAGVSQDDQLILIADYIDQQSFIEKADLNASVYNNDFVGAFSYNIFVGVYVATIFGSAFFFDLFWPERKESAAVKMAWRICSVLACAFTLSSALLITIILATHNARITGVSAAEARHLLSVAQPNQPLIYKHNKRGIASVVFIWVGMVSTIASTALLWHSLSHIDKLGPFSTHAREKQPVQAGGVEETRGSEAQAPATQASGPHVPEAQASAPAPATQTGEV